MKKVSILSIKEEKAILNENMNLSSIKQLQLINMLYMDDEFNEKKSLLSELKKKRNGYKQQDQKKEIYSEHHLISVNEIIEKLVSSKLHCFYCKNELLLFFKNKRDDYQWTLDRVDNDLPHTNDNTIISCLKCNLDRRVKDINTFTFSKQLKIVKKE